MLFAIEARYTADQERMNAIRPTHRAYLQGLLDEGKLAAAGPYTDGSGALFVYSVETAEQAEELVAADPYSVNGIILEHTVRPWQIVFSNTDALKAG